MSIFHPNSSIPMILLCWGGIISLIKCNQGGGLEKENKDEKNVDCDAITKDSPWEVQKPIHPCHYETHDHPRQVPRKNRTETEIKEFHHLAIFNIRYDLDFQESGDPCSVRLQQEWLLTGGDVNSSEPVPLSEYSFNRIWYKRLCNFFSYLECIPKDEVRVKGTNAVNTSSTRSHVFKTELNFPDSERNTIGKYRMKIGGRGPGKGRHKSGPGGDRVDPTKLLGLPIAIPVEGYPLDGVCVCSYFDPEFTDRKRPDYGMNFVEDEAREHWCVAAPGNLCGRTYFKRNLWPGQSFEFSDHIGCPKMFRGDEYECIRWQANYVKDHTHDGKPKGSPTATCEKKQEDPEFLAEAKKAADRAEVKKQKKKRTKSVGATINYNYYHVLIISTLFIFISLRDSF